MRPPLAILLALLSVWAANCAAEPWPWGALVIGRMDDGPSDPRLEKYLVNLKRIFGYRRYEIYGEAWGTGPAKGDSVVMPTNEFFVRLHPRGAGERRIGFEFLRKDRVLVDGEAVMPVSAPLFITGPEYGNGKLVMIIEIRDATQKGQ
ncbi:MAG TPA: hypothetical protein PLU30_13130 [Verrucomicrobiae bacterium]|nr:hypothetical protein [Verrucomicrobiae bacterium]